MPLPPRPKQRLLVKRAIAVSTIALGCGGGQRPQGVPPQVVRDPAEVTQPPQVNCAGQYAGECRGALEIVIKGDDGAPLANKAVRVTIAGAETVRGTDERGAVVIGSEPGAGMPPGGVAFKLVVDGYVPVEQTVGIDDGLATVEVRLVRQPAP